MARIMEAAMDNADVATALGAAEYITTKTTEHPDGIELHHTLLYERLDGKEEFDGKIEVIGGKTGYTDEARNCLVTMARVVETGKSGNPSSIRSTCTENTSASTTTASTCQSRKDNKKPPEGGFFVSVCDVFMMQESF